MQLLRITISTLIATKKSQMMLMFYCNQEKPKAGQKIIYEFLRFIIMNQIQGRCFNKCGESEINSV